MVRQSINRHSTWLRRLLPACDNDPSVAKRQLAWMKEKIISDRAHHGININNTTPLTPLTKTEIDIMDTFISQRVDQHMPLQYILGTQPFYDLDIITRPPTLIPRWETEEWTCRLVELLRPYWERQHQRKPALQRRRILDVCTGTGCIALALAAHLPKNSTDIIGVDISDKAIQLANDNQKAHADLLNGNKVHFQRMDIYDSKVEQQLFSSSSSDDDGPFDLVVSNPPYVTQDEYASLDPEVKQWEDKGALVADDLGTHLHRRLIELVAHSSNKHNNNTNHDGLPRIVMEIGGAHQVPTLQQALDDRGFNNIKVWKDLAGKDRVILAS